MRDLKKRVTLYTDGACSGNPGPGGWGCILIYKGHQKELHGFEPNTINNRMELQGVIKGLETLKYPCIVEIFTDSSYICDSINKGWIHSWLKHDWKTAKGKLVKNIDLWKELISLLEIHQCTFNWVKGHPDNIYNNRCDELARMTIYKKN